MSVNWNDTATIARFSRAANIGVARGIRIAETEAVRSIMEGPKTGTIYNKQKPKRTHQASAPDESPANDLGRLVNSRTVEDFPAQNRSRLTFRTDYALKLEVGTPNMEARPYARRALNVKLDEIQDAVRSEIAKAAKGGGV
jgi:hypothetical protein